MSSSTFTLIGLKNYMDYFEHDIFQNMTLPEGIDKEDCINNILLTCGDNELLYPDGQFMIDAIGLWSTKWYRTFEKWVTVLNQEYNPLENTDRHEDWSDSLSESYSESELNSLSSFNSTSESMNTSTSVSMSESNQSSTSESNNASASDSSYNSNSNESDVSAFNDSSFSHDSAAKLNGNANSVSNSKGNGLTQTNGNNIHAENNNELSARLQGEKFDETNHKKLQNQRIQRTGHKGYIHGNIGTMTTQYLLREELETQRFNLLDEIAIIFAREFTLAL